MTVRLVHRTTTGDRLSFGILPKNLASHGRSSNDGTTFIACRTRFCGLLALLQFPVGASFREGRPASAGYRARRRAVLVREFSGPLPAAPFRAGKARRHEGALRPGVLLAELRERTRHDPRRVAATVRTRREGILWVLGRSPPQN